MLYVDEDNTAAVRMYTALGFSRWSTDVMYRPALGRSARAMRCLIPSASSSSLFGERPVARRDGREHLGVELYLTKRHVIVNTKVNLHGNRAHLLRPRASPLRPSGYVATPFLRMTHRGHSQTTLAYVLPGLPLTIP